MIIHFLSILTVSLNPKITNFPDQILEGPVTNSPGIMPGETGPFL